VPKYQPVGAGEQCPCGSGKPYLECCLDREFKYMRDEKGKVIKLPHNFEVRSLPKKQESNVEKKERSDDEPEVKDISPLLVIDICEHGEFSVHIMINIDLNKVQLCDLKAIMGFIERQKVVVAIAITRGGKKREMKEDVIPMVVTGTDEDGEIIMIGGARPEDLQGFEEKNLLEVVDYLEELRMSLMAITIQKTIAHFMFPHSDFDDDEDDSE